MDTANSGIVLKQRYIEPVNLPANSVVNSSIMQINDSLPPFDKQRISVESVKSYKEAPGRKTA
jgi:hypothetical protein